MQVGDPGPSDAVKSSVKAPPQAPVQQRVLVLAGVVGSGKSTFANALCLCDRNWVRASQDVLGSRQAVESYVLRELQQGKSVCIDRTNVDAKQRATWLRLAKEYQDRSPHIQAVIVDAVTFTTPYAECARRLLARTEHETIHDPHIAVRLLATFTNQFRPPSTSEGFHRIVSIDTMTPMQEGPEILVEEVMRKVDQSPYLISGPTRGPTAAAQTQTLQQRGGGRVGWGALERGRGQRGRGRGRGRARGNWQGGRAVDFRDSQGSSSTELRPAHPPNPVSSRPRPANPWVAAAAGAGNRVWQPPPRTSQQSHPPQTTPEEATPHIP